MIDESRAGRPAASSAATRDRDPSLDRARRCPPGPTAVVPVERTERDGDRRARGGVRGRRQRATRRRGRARRRPRSAARHRDSGRPSSAWPRRWDVAGLPARGVRAWRVLVTGDELVEPGEQLGPGRIYSSNAFVAERAGGARGRRADRARDRRRQRRVHSRARSRGRSTPRTSSACRAACRSGRTTTSSRRSGELGVEERFWGVRLRPGKPTWFGTRGADARLRAARQPGVGDGHVRAVRAPGARRAPGRRPREATPSARRTRGDVRQQPRREHAVRVSLERRRRWLARGHHRRPGLARADLDARRATGWRWSPAGDGELRAGARVEVELL